MSSRRLAYVLLLSCLVACGKIPEADDDTDDPDGGDMIDAGPTDPCDHEDGFDTDEFIDCYIGLTCTMFVECGLAFPDEDTCRAQFATGEASSGVRRIRDSIAAGRIVLDQDEIDLCIDAFEARIASGVCTFSEPEACGRIFAGQVTGSDTCFEDDECLGAGSRCSACSTEQCCAGTCTRAAGEGGSCAGDLPCERGLHCVGDPDQSLCQDGEAGSPCSDDYQCDDAFFCSEGACVADVTDDRACERTAQCIEPLICIQGTCQHAYEGDDCETECQFGFLCQVPPAGGPGTCVPLGNQVGDDCTTDCLKGFICVDGKCAERPQVGETCQPYTCAYGLFCTAELPGSGEPVSGECAQPQADGAACSGSSHCASAMCVNNLCEAYQVCE